MTVQPGMYTPEELAAEMMKERPDAVGALAERVSALEECLAHPPMLAGAAPLSAEDEARMREAFAEAMANPQPLKILPPRPLLTPETARALLRECVTVVKPGEVLVMAMPEWMTPNQAREVYDVVRYWCEAEGLDLKVLVVPSCEFAVMKADAG